jgi:ABC-2 type transport system ATP-binding protein
MATHKDAIRTHALGRRFGSITAVEDLNLVVPRGTIFGFLGPNGSGKTTTIRMLLGLLEPTSGGAEVLGLNVATQAAEIRERAGALLERDGLYERLSAYDNLEFYARIWHLPRPARRARIRELLVHLDLWERRDDQVATWSRGMRQKLAVARAMLHHPRLIILDEPTAGLDPVAAAALRADIASLVAREGTTVFLNTHNLGEAEKLCDLVGVIRYGKLLAVDSPDGLRALRASTQIRVIGRAFGPRVVEALRARAEVWEAAAHADHLTLTVAPDAEVGPLVSLMVGQGVQVEEVRRGESSLESVFLKLMAEAESPERAIRAAPSL